MNRQTFERNGQNVLGTEDMEITCTKCNISKNQINFDVRWKDHFNNKILKKICTSCASFLNKTRYKLKKENINLKTEFCDCCGKKEEKLAIDHDHATKEFRGWICQNCNTSLGIFKDDINLLNKVKEYLKNGNV